MGHEYAKIHILIIASVSEQQPMTWVSFFFDLRICVYTFPAGLQFCVKNINDERVFLLFVQPVMSALPEDCAADVDFDSSRLYAVWNCLLKYL